MRSALTFKMNASTEEEVREHLLACDARFTPPLSTRVDIAAYAKKIRDEAWTFEAWNRRELAGLVAAYVDPAKRTCFITNVSVLDEHAGKGIATRLVGACLERAEAAGIDAASLEVSEQDDAGLRLCARRGFRAVEKRAGSVLLRRATGDRAWP
ncbi:MAG: GNAT family N-acetyltransferase [Betaproteobacteria bacterium]|nr:GNAT family N-acetyltransferase [Betaproteobacteria bacterium]